jgi:hypothetical protein
MDLALTRFAVFDALFAANFWSLVLPGVSAGSVVTVHKYRSHGVSIAEGVGALSVSRAIELAAFSALCLVGFYYGSAAAPRNTVALPAALLLLVVALLMAMRRCAHRFSELLERRSDGIRDAAVLAATAPLGIPSHAAVAIATLMLGTVILNGLLGGLLQLILPWYPRQATRGDRDSRRPSFTNTHAN